MRSACAHVQDLRSFSLSDPQVHNYLRSYISDLLRSAHAMFCSAKPIAATATLTRSSEPSSLDELEGCHAAVLVTIEVVEEDDHKQSVRRDV
jgi:hypothetical protein